MKKLEVRKLGSAEAGTAQPTDMEKCEFYQWDYEMSRAVDCNTGICLWHYPDKLECADFRCPKLEPIRKFIEHLRNKSVCFVCFAGNNSMNAHQHLTTQINAVHPTGPHSPGWIAASHCYFPPNKTPAAGRVFLSLIFPACRIAFVFIFFSPSLERLQQNGKLNQVFSSLVKPPTFLFFSHGLTQTTTDKQNQAHELHELPRIVFFLFVSVRPCSSVASTNKGDYHE